MFDSPQVKRSLKFTIENIVYEFPHKLPTDVKLRKLGNIRFLPKNKTLVKYRKNTEKITSKVLVLSNFACFLLFFPNTLSKVLYINKILFIIRPGLLKLEYFSMFYNFKVFLKFFIQILSEQVVEKFQIEEFSLSNFTYLA